MDESSSSSSYKRAKAPGNINNKEVGGCLVDGCDADLRECREYHRRHKVCEAHSKTPVVTIAGRHQRFCQQCSRFHSLGEFDEGKRSCRKRLDGHNRRRRKLPQPPVNQHHPGGLLLFSSTHQQQQQQQQQQYAAGGGGGGRLLSFSSPSQTLPEMMVHYNMMNYHQNSFNHQHHQQMEEFLLPCQNAAADPALSLLSPTPPREFGNLGMEHASSSSSSSSSSSFQFCSDQGSSTAPPHHTLTFTFD